MIQYVRGVRLIDYVVLHTHAKIKKQRPLAHRSELLFIFINISINSIRIYEVNERRCPARAHEIDQTPAPIPP